MPEVFLLNAKRNVQADINAVARAENTLKTWEIPEEEIQAVRDEVKNYASDKDRRAKEKERLKQWARRVKVARRWIHYRVEHRAARDDRR